MTGKQNIPVKASAHKLVAPIQAEARNSVDTAKIMDMNSTTEEYNSKKKHTNTTSIVVGIIGCTIIGYIIYNLLVFTS